MESILNVSAHKHGNYHKYYEFHPATCRTSLMEKDNIFLKMWQSQNEPEVFSILDVGCNEGDLSVDILKLAVKELPSHVKCVVLGVDIDSSLIDLANSKYSNDTVTFKAITFMDPVMVSEYFTTYFKENNLTGFNFISMFSITMWIHLNHDDAGLKQFINEGIKHLTPLGSILIEPQPWKCYKAANKRCRKLGMPKPLYYETLQMKDIDREITDYLMKSCGMKSFWCLGKEIWGRSILIFHQSEHEVLQSLVAAVAPAAVVVETVSSGVEASESKTEGVVDGASDSPVNKKVKV